jgi:hypothetical protein
MTDVVVVLAGLSSLMFASKAGAYLSGAGVFSHGRLLVLLANFRRGWKRSRGANTLAYLAHS